MQLRAEAPVEFRQPCPVSTSTSSGPTSTRSRQRPS